MIQVHVWIPLTDSMIKFKYRRRSNWYMSLSEEQYKVLQQSLYTFLSDILLVDSDIYSYRDRKNSYSIIRYKDILYKEYIFSIHPFRRKDMVEDYVFILPECKWIDHLPHVYTLYHSYENSVLSSIRDSRLCTYKGYIDYKRHKGVVDTYYSIDKDIEYDYFYYPDNISKSKQKKSTLGHRGWNYRFKSWKYLTKDRYQWMHNL